MTAALFARGIGQTLRVQRQAIERVVGEQVADAEPIERSLAEAPIPAEDVEEAQPELISWVGAATGAHMTALAQIAVDLENRVRDSYGNSTE